MIYMKLSLHIHIRSHTEEALMTSLFVTKSCCCLSSWSSALWWRLAAAAPSGWRALDSSHSGLLRVYCALIEKQQKHNQSNKQTN